MTERNFDFLMPSVNFFGPGVISKIGERAKTLGMHKPVIVTDKFLESLPDGAVAQVRRSLDAAGIDYVIYNQVEPNPKIHNIQAVKALYQANQADSLITIGGGSAHDTGKGAGIIMTNGDDITKLAGDRNTQECPTTTDCGQHYRWDWFWIDPSLCHYEWRNAL